MTPKPTTVRLTITVDPENAQQAAFLRAFLLRMNVLWAKSSPESYVKELVGEDAYPLFAKVKPKAKDSSKALVIIPNTPAPTPSTTVFTAASNTRYTPYVAPEARYRILRLVERKMPMPEKIMRLLDKSSNRE